MTQKNRIVREAPRISRRQIGLGVLSLATVAAAHAGSAGRGETARRQRSGRKDWFETIPGERMVLRVGSAETAGKLTVLESIVSHAAATPLHYHAVEESFLILSGSLRLICGGEWRSLTAGEAAVVPAGAHHGFTNTSGAPVRMLAMFTPGGIEQLFFRLNATPPERWAELAKHYDTIVVGPPVAE